MAFNSIHFLVFFPTVLAVSWMLRRNMVARLGFLLAASYYFYMSWNVAYAGLIFGSTLLDFVAAKRMHTLEGSARRNWLIASLAGNLGVLFAFKYYNFFVESVGALFPSSPISLGQTTHSLLLPVGISFYTFQSLSYSIDVYRKRLEPADSFLKFALFVSFFPQLVAGPIVRASCFLPQLDCKPKFDDRRATKALGRMLLGAFKKVCIADVLGSTIVDVAFADAAGQSSFGLLLAMYAYAFQIYYDFSGYSDMAIGAAGMMGFDLPENFRHPFRATSARNFWHRWHISLSTWLRDYLFIPLGGSRGSTLATARNLAIVMVLGGLWHGAAWGFVIWGALHGMLLGVGRLFQTVAKIDPDRTDQPMASRVVRIAVTFHLVAICFVVFRAASLSDAWAFFSTMVTSGATRISIPPLGCVVLVTAMGLEWLPTNWLAFPAQTYLRLPSPLQAGAIVAGLLAFSVLGGSAQPFIYFQF